MKKLLLLLFGHKDRVTNIQRTVTKFKSSYPTNRPSLQEWAKEFKFGMLYDRKIIYMD
jgi:hypothetical protein